MEILFHPGMRGDNAYMGGRDFFVVSSQLSAQRVYVPPQPGCVLPPAAAWCFAGENSPQDREVDWLKFLNLIRVLSKNVI